MAKTKKGDKVNLKNLACLIIVLLLVAPVHASSPIKFSAGEWDLSRGKELWIESPVTLRVKETDLTTDQYAVIATKVKRPDGTVNIYIVTATTNGYIILTDGEEDLKIEISSPEDVEYKRETKERIKELETELQELKEEHTNLTIYKTELEFKYWNLSIRADELQHIVDNELTQRGSNICLDMTEKEFQAAMDAAAHRAIKNNLPWYIRYMSYFIVAIIIVYIFRAVRHGKKRKEAGLA